MSHIEPIKNSITKQVKVPAFEQRYTEIKQQVLEQPAVQQFLTEYQLSVNSEIVQRGMATLFEFTDQTHVCCGKGGTGQCSNVMQGHIPNLTLSNSQIGIVYRKCEQMLKEDQQREIASMVKTMYMPKDVLNAKLPEMDMQNKSRLDAVNFIVDFMNQYREQQELPKNALYLYGTFGVGKTYILGALANELSQERIPSLLVYMPEFIRELKSSLKEGTLEEKMDYVKKIPVLMLDDIGSEPISSWTRDEIIGSILHYRMAEQLPTFMTSNFTYEQLEQQWSRTENGAVDELKAGRILQRVKVLTTPLEITGLNRRN